MPLEHKSHVRLQRKAGGTVNYATASLPRRRHIVASAPILILRLATLRSRSTEQCQQG